MVIYLPNPVTNIKGYVNCDFREILTIILMNFQPLIVKMCKFIIAIKTALNANH